MINEHICNTNLSNPQVSESRGNDKGIISFAVSSQRRPHPQRQQEIDACSGLGGKLSGQMKKPVPWY